MKIQLKMTVANHDARINQVGDNTWEIIDVSLSFFFSELGVFFFWLTTCTRKKERERKKKRSFSFDIFPRSSSLPTWIILWCSPKCVVVSLTACALLLRRLAVYHTMLSGSLCVSLARRLIFFFFLVRYIFFFPFFFLPSSFPSEHCAYLVESVAIWVHGDRSRRWTNSLFRSIRLVYL